MATVGTGKYKEYPAHSVEVKIIVCDCCGEVIAADSGGFSTSIIVCKQVSWSDGYDSLTEEFEDFDVCKSCFDTKIMTLMGEGK